MNASRETRSQRWRDRREAYVPDSTVIDPRAHSVDVVSCHAVAKPFVERHHYSGSFPASRLSLGLFRNGPGGRSELVGVCTFAQPVNNAAIPKHTGLEHHRQAVDLGRLVLLDDVAGNGESWFVARALRLLRQQKPEVLSVISYADPMVRVAADGSVLKPGHVGQVYQASGAAYRGRTKPRYELHTPDGQLFSERAITKIRSGETGHAYAIDELVSRGAPACAGDPRAWLRRLSDEGFLLRRRHAGNHVYVFEMTQAARMAARGLPRLSYPGIDRAQPCADVTALPLPLAA